METRRLGNSDLDVSVIGLGCMSIGAERQQAKAIIERAIDLGINYLDTADLYDQGLNEEMIGDVIKDKRQEIILATKVGNRFEKGKEGWTWDPSKQHIIRSVKESLLRLQTDYIDLYQLHGGTIEDNIDETIDAFEELKKEGLIRQYGISSIRPNVIREYVERSSIVTVMMQYSLLDRRPEELFPLLQEKHVSVVARGPLAKGLLTERPLSEASSIREKGYLDYTYEELYHVQEAVKQVGSVRSLQANALLYDLSHPVVASVVTGASKLSQVEANVQAVEEPALSNDELLALKSLTKASTYQQHR
ncbi:aldo/keto reductase [Halalkalibacter urbisdiaboli]|uniref:aldo/keto reductase n=1 Tax=Halalkalibacter urbisdiaboli TaxID=1960589 RepID=UPI000B451FAB|nr:aldo/keto reductase [Halalkalibacter urbisdiaboli]